MKRLSLVRPAGGARVFWMLTVGVLLMGAEQTWGQTSASLLLKPWEEGR